MGFDEVGSVRWVTLWWPTLPQSSSTSSHVDSTVSHKRVTSCKGRAAAAAAVHNSSLFVVLIFGCQIAKLV